MIELLSLSDRSLCVLEVRKRCSCGHCDARTFFSHSPGGVSDAVQRAFEESKTSDHFSIFRRIN